MPGILHARKKKVLNFGTREKQWQTIFLMTWQWFTWLICCGCTDNFLPMLPTYLKGERQNLEWGCFLIQREDLTWMFRVAGQEVSKITSWNIAKQQGTEKQQASYIKGENRPSRSAHRLAWTMSWLWGKPSVANNFQASVKFYQSACEPKYVPGLFCIRFKAVMAAVAFSAGNDAEKQ